MKNQIKTVFLLGVLSTLVIGIGSAISPGHLPMFVIFALLMNVGSYYFSDRIVLRMHGAKPVDEAQFPELHEMLRELAGRAEIPVPKLYMIADAQPNAFATGRNPAHGVVAVTQGIVQLLSPRELRGVIAHELAHIKNRDILISTIAAVMGSVVSGVANMLQWTMMFGGQRDEEEGSEGGGLLMMLVAPVISMLVQMGISRSREYLADETGARIAGDPEALASALQKLERGVERMPGSAHTATASLFIMNPFAGAGGLVRMFSTHPPVADRVARLMALSTRLNDERGLRGATTTLAMQ